MLIILTVIAIILVCLISMSFANDIVKSPCEKLQRLNNDIQHNIDLHAWMISKHGDATTMIRKNITQKTARLSELLKTITQLTTQANEQALENVEIENAGKSSQQKLQVIVSKLRSYMAQETPIPSVDILHDLN